MEISFLLSLCFIVKKTNFLPLGISCEELSPVNNEESSLEDNTVILSYTYSKQADGSDNFFWYRQYPGKPPEFLISHSGTGKLLSDSVSRLSFKVREDKTRMHLQISSAAVTDSAVYYCAVKPTRATSSSRRCTTSALCSTILSIITAAVKRTTLTLNVEHQLVSPVH
uniref:Immunoglobulin V-set domain-containing protein n=1 Tax=Sparus aurata TaxID=8175 RepID=A0A671U9T0_SPAAU